MPLSDQQTTKKDSGDGRCKSTKRPAGAAVELNPAAKASKVPAKFSLLQHPAFPDCGTRFCMSVQNTFVCSICKTEFAVLLGAMAL